MTPAEIIHKTFMHFAEQGERAANEYGSCHYRITRNGRQLKCAVGFWIKDEDYKPDLEGNGVWVAEVQDTLPRELDGHIDVLEALQVLHDNSFNWNSPEHMLSAMQQLAGQFRVPFRLGEIEPALFANWKGELS